MNRIRYSTNDGKEYFEILGVNWDYAHKIFNVHIIHMFLTNGIPRCEEKYYSIFNNIINVLDFSVDPDWDANSNPPKPKNFDITDPATWGDLMWQDIPKITTSPEQYFSEFVRKSIIHNTEYTLFENLDYAILSYLTSIKELPVGDQWTYARNII